MKRKFTKDQNKVLSEIYRRLNYFHNGDLNTSLLLLAMPSEAKKIADIGLIRSHSKELRGVLNWYSLTERGKLFFSNYVTKTKLSNETNSSIFNGSYVKNFDYLFLIAKNE